jgi:hypothetical protein
LSHNLQESSSLSLTHTRPCWKYDRCPRLYGQTDWQNLPTWRRRPQSH